MEQYDLQLLDCTLRDGGYVNQWKWGFQTAREIISYLVKAKVEVVEVGFLRNVEKYDPDITVCNTIEELNRLLPTNRGNTIFSAMAMRSNYDVAKLTPYNGNGIEMVRVTFHDYDIEEGLEFAEEIKNRGYKVSVNPINIMGYSDEKILWIIERVNAIHPYQFSVVDTFGSMKRRDLNRIVSLVDNNLDRNIRLALHLHENMSLSCCLAQDFITMHLHRPTAIDGSLMGMGRIPGNLPIELIADYINENTDKAYDIDYLMDAIEDHISVLKGKSEWGYMTAYFLSARFNLHRNYAEYYLGKGDLTNRDINHILARIDHSKKNVFDSLYAEKLYREYKENEIDDTNCVNELIARFKGRKILIIAPGKTILAFNSKIEQFISGEKPIVISVNFVPEMYKCDYAFFSNNKRYNQIDASCETIITSNLEKRKDDFVVDYNSLSGAFDQGCNSLIMLLALMKRLGVERVTAAGADGYTQKDSCYYDSSMRSSIVRDNKFNLAVQEAIRKLDVKVEYLTPSKYEY